MTTNGALLAFTFGLCVSGPAFAEAPPATRPEAVQWYAARAGCTVGHRRPARRRPLCKQP